MRAPPKAAGSAGHGGGSSQGASLRPCGRAHAPRHSGHLLAADGLVSVSARLAAKGTQEALSIPGPWS